MILPHANYSNFLLTASRHVESFDFSTYSCAYCLRHFGTLIASIFPLYHAIAICFDAIVVIVVAAAFFTIQSKNTHTQCRCKTVVATWNCKYKRKYTEDEREKNGERARPLKCRELLYIMYEIMKILLWHSLFKLFISFHSNLCRYYFFLSFLSLSRKFHNTFSKISLQY